MKWVLRWELSHFDWKWRYRSVLVIMLSEGAGIDRKRAEEKDTLWSFVHMMGWAERNKMCPWMSACVCIHVGPARHGGPNVTVMCEADGHVCRKSWEISNNNIKDVWKLHWRYKWEVHNCSEQNKKWLSKSQLIFFVLSSIYLHPTHTHTPTPSYPLPTSFPVSPQTSFYFVFQCCMAMCCAV